MVKKNLLFGMLFGLLIVCVGFVSANTLDTSVNEPLFLKMVCAGNNSFADITVFSGVTNNPDNMVISRTAMDKISEQDFIYTATFSMKGTYTAFEECSYDGGFISTQQTTIIVNDPVNLIDVSSYKNYNYQANLFYNVYFKSNPKSVNTIDFELQNDTITFQPLDLSYSNTRKKADNEKTQLISNPKNVVGYPSGNTFLYQNVYGQGLDLQYLVNKNYVKEELVINDASALPNLDKKLSKNNKIDKNITLELNSLMTTTTNHIIVNGKEWNMKKPVTTSNIVLIKNDAGDIIYQLQIPVAFDSDGAKVVGSYTLENVKHSKNSDQVEVTVKMPYSWFVDSARVYPLFLDPTIDTPDGTGVFDDSVPQIIIENLTIPADSPYLIVETLTKGNSTILDAECELNIVDDATQEDAVYFRSFADNWDGTYQFLWGMPNTDSNPYVGDFTLSSYCWHGETLVLNKVYSISSIGVY